MIKNYGFIEPKIETREEGAEHILGALQQPVINPSGIWDWTGGEPQRRNNIETNGCTVFNTLRAIQTLIKFKTGISVNYSDRYLANVAKFKGILNPSVGADPHRVLELVRNVAGCLKEERLPWSSEIKTAEDYYDVQNLAEFMKEGAQWYNEWELGHEYCWSGILTPSEKERAIKNSLPRGPVLVSLVAWKYDEVNKWYYKDNGDRDGHWTGLERYDGSKPIVEDSYPESEGDFEKVLSPLYDFGVAKVLYLSPASEKLSIIQQILSVIAKLIPALSFLVEKKVEELKPEPPEPPELPPKFLWDTPENVRHSVRVICDEEGLRWEMKNRLDATVKCESGYNTKAVNENRDANGKLLSTDWGICQWNDYYNIGVGKPIPSRDVAMNDPEFCVRQMCKFFLQGKQHLWVCYKKIYGSI